MNPPSSALRLERSDADAPRAALQVVLDAQGEPAELKAVIDRLERIAAEVERIEETVNVQIPAPVG